MYSLMNRWERSIAALPAPGFKPLSVRATVLVQEHFKALQPYVTDLSLIGAAEDSSGGLCFWVSRSKPKQPQSVISLDPVLSKQPLIDFKGWIPPARQILDMVKGAKPPLLAEQLNRPDSDEESFEKV
jgi:hypothetical protein